MGITCKPVGKMKRIMKRMENELLKEQQKDRKKDRGARGDKK